MAKRDNRATIVAVTGADSGLGAAIIRQLQIYGIETIPVYGPEQIDGFDFTDPEQVSAASDYIKRKTESLGIDRKDRYPILVNAAGVNYIEWFRNAWFDQFEKLMRINVRAPLELVQFLMEEDDVETAIVWSGDWFGESGAILNIVSNASHVPMTNSVFYNATKGALHIATLALARELRKTDGICVFGVSPNKLKGTKMSSYIEGRVPSLRNWTPEQAAGYQLAALPAGEETDPNTLAEFIAFLLSSPERHKYLTNTVIPYGA